MVYIKLLISVRCSGVL